MDLTCGFWGYREEDCLWDRKCKEYKKYLRYVATTVKDIAGYYNHFIIGDGGGVYKDIENVLKKLQQNFYTITYEVTSENLFDVLLNKCDYILVFCSAHLIDYVNYGLKIIDKEDKYYDKYLLKCIKNNQII